MKGGNVVQLSNMRVGNQYNNIGSANVSPKKGAGGNLISN